MVEESCFSVIVIPMEPPLATTSYELSLAQNTKRFQVQSLTEMEPLLQTTSHIICCISLDITIILTTRKPQ